MCVDIIHIEIYINIYKCKYYIYIYINVYVGNVFVIGGKRDTLYIQTQKQYF